MDHLNLRLICVFAIVTVVLSSKWFFFTPPPFTAVCLSVCLCVCVCMCVCPAVLVNKIPAKRMHRFGRSFRYMAAYRTGSNSIEIGDLGSKVKVTVTWYPFFLHNSLLTSLPCISALLCFIKMSLWYTLGRFVFKFHEIRMGDDVIMTSFKFSPNNYPYLNFYWT